MSTRVRRACAISAAGGLASALAWLPAGSASASPLPSEFQATSNVNADTGTCPLTSGSSSASSPGALPTSGTHKQSVSIAAGFTNSGDSTDSVQFSGHYQSTLVLKAPSGHLNSLKLSGTGHLDMLATKGKATACNPSGLMAGVTELNFSQSKAGWFYINRKLSDKKNLSIAAILNTDTGAPAVVDVFQGGPTNVAERAFVPKGGHWGAEVAAGITVGNEGLILRSAPVNSVSMVFHAAGTALSGASGTGKQFVRFPSSISCSHHTARLTWTGKAGQVKSGSFSVNGVKKGADGHPVAGHSVVLRHLSPTADNKITAKLALKNGGTATATRTYIPCKA